MGLDASTVKTSDVQAVNARGHLYHMKEGESWPLCRNQFSSINALDGKALPSA
jgi:hypothetical protein